MVLTWVGVVCELTTEINDECSVHGNVVYNSKLLWHFQMQALSYCLVCRERAITRMQNSFSGNASVDWRTHIMVSIQSLLRVLTGAWFLNSVVENVSLEQSFLHGYSLVSLIKQTDHASCRWTVKKPTEIPTAIYLRQSRCPCHNTVVDQNISRITPSFHSSQWRREE